MSRRLKRLFIFIGFLAVIGLVFLFIWLFAIRDNSQRTPTNPDYSESILQLHSNGVFSLELFFNEAEGPAAVFIGHGFWERSGNQIYLEFVDTWEILGYTSFTGQTIPFYRYRRGLRFVAPDGRIIYFS